MNIGDAARATGVSVKMIRYYEEIGLLPAAGRTEAGYRVYDDKALNRLRFVRRARSLGFAMPRIRVLLGLWHDRHRASSDVKQQALAHVAELDARIAELAAMRDALSDLAQACHGDDRPDCPILRDLAQGVG
jgi:MerR family transcriptional regulator, copper efflux regulator